MSETITLPPISLPIETVILLFDAAKVDDSIISRTPTVALALFGTSIPTAALFGIGASIRTPAVARLSAISSARLVILLIFTPAFGCSSYRVTVGPRLTSTIRVSTPKLCNVSTSSFDVVSSSFATSLLVELLMALSKLIGGYLYICISLSFSEISFATASVSFLKSTVMRSGAFCSDSSRAAAIASSTSTVSSTGIYSSSSVGVGISSSL